MSATRIEVSAGYVNQLTGGGQGYFANQSFMLVQGLFYLRAAYGGGTPGVGPLAVAAPWIHGPRPLAAAFTLQQGPGP